MFCLLRCLMLALFLVTPAHACAWDRDTLAAEAKGLPDVVQVITGRFERNPPLFYEMRLARVKSELKAQPAKLELFDDAAVACDRLHRSKDAIAWMAQKRAHLKPFPQDKEHWYRYHANLGTFQAHDWLRSGANRKNLSQMKSASNHIATAIEINPDAHFGREKYQLMAMKWIVEPPKPKAEEAEFIVRMPSFVGAPYSSETRGENSKNTAEGLSGLIVLGAAWESVDVFYALAISQSGSNSSIAYLAWLRCRELVQKGAKSLWPGVPSLSALKDYFESPRNGPHYSGISDGRPVERAYTHLRSEADEYQKRRLDYATARLTAGRHPDTDKDFWNEWRETKPPSLWFYKSSLQWIFEALYWFPRAICALIAWMIFRFVRRKRRRVAA